MAAATIDTPVLDAPGDLEPIIFPPAQYRMINCTNDRDYPFDFASSHQYYRRSATVRADIAQTMTGAIG